MRKFKTKNGYIAYKTTTAEIMITGGRGICDECGTFHPEGGYLVPVLNHWQCEECFNDFQEKIGYYPEDIPFERSRAAYYEKMIPLTEGEEQSDEDRVIHNYDDDRIYVPDSDLKKLNEITGSIFRKYVYALVNPKTLIQCGNDAQQLIDKAFQEKQLSRRYGVTAAKDHKYGHIKFIVTFGLPEQIPVTLRIERKHRKKGSPNE